MGAQMVKEVASKANDAISMITVICILPSMLMLFDKVIINTTMGMKKKENKLYKLPEIN